MGGAYFGKFRHLVPAHIGCLVATIEEQAPFGQSSKIRHCPRDDVQTLFFSAQPRQAIEKAPGVGVQGILENLADV